MTLHTSPILHSLLDTDAYKLHMQQAVYHHYYDVDVAAEFRCRGDELLGVYADEIAHQVDLMRFLSLNDDEFTYLSSLPFFKPDYLHWLRGFRFNPQQVSIKNNAGKLDIRITGPWREVILWEVPLLAVISEVVHRHRSPNVTAEQALVQALLSVWSELGLKSQSDWIREGGRAGVGGKAVEQLWTPEQLGLTETSGARLVPDAGGSRVQPLAL